MKAEEIIEVLEDFGAGSGEAYDKWLKRLKEAVYLEISEALKYSRDDEVETYSTSLAAFVMSCYRVNVVELVLKLVKLGRERMILESIERFIEEKKERHEEEKK
jgi:hypothetical protein